MGIAETVQLSAEDDIFLRRLEQVRVSHPDNRCARFLSRELFTSFDTGQRDRLRRCCRSGVENPDSILGCYILQPDDLHEFSEFFGPLVAEDRRPPRTAFQASGQSPVSQDELELSSLGLPPSSIRMRVGRNLQGFRLPAGMDRAERVRLERFLAGALDVLADDPFYAGGVVSLTPDFGLEPNPNLITTRRRQDLIDGGLMFRNMQEDRFMRSANLAADWPYGRACYVSADKTVIVWIGEEDHLRIISMATGTKLTEAYDRLVAVLAAIEAIPGVDFIRDGAYGYVTSCPSNLGTGLRPSVLVTLPELVGPDLDPKAFFRQFGLAARGMVGEHSLIGADGRMDLSPIHRALRTDREILEALTEGLRGLALARQGAPREPPALLPRQYRHRSGV